MTRRPTVVVVGCGSIGLRHLRHLVASGADAIGVDSDAAAREAAVALGVAAHGSLDEVGAADAALICTPATSHVDAALRALDRGLDVFIEKPLAADLLDARRLLSRTGDRVIAVGYNLRFVRALVALRERLVRGAIGRPLWARVEFGQSLPDWRPGRDYRQSVSARAALGGGILLEASHELDLLRWLFGEWSSLTALVRRRSSLEIDVEDTVAGVLEMESGLIVEVHLDMVRPGYRRSVVCVGEAGTLEWEFASGSAFISREGRRELLCGPDGAERMYIDELRAFLDRVRDRGRPAVGVAEGLAALQLVEAARRSSASGSTVHR